MNKRDAINQTLFEQAFFGLHSTEADKVELEKNPRRFTPNLMDRIEALDFRRNSAGVWRLPHG